MHDEDATEAMAQTEAPDRGTPTFAEASMATVIRIDDGLRELGLDTAQLPLARPWDNGGVR